MSRSNKSIRIRDIAIQTNKNWNKIMRESTLHVWLREWNSFGIFGEVELATNTLDTQWCPPIQTKRAVTDRISVRSETSWWYVDPRCSMLSTSRSYSACRRISSRIGRFRSPPVRTYKLLFLCDYLIYFSDSTRFVFLGGDQHLVLKWCYSFSLEVLGFQTSGNDRVIFLLFSFDLFLLICQSSHTLLSI